MIQQSQAKLIVGATLIDGTSDRPLPNANVLIRGDRIAAVSQGAPAAVDGAEIVSARGKWLMPGLFDMHVHYMDWMPELFLNHGITSIVDLSQHPWIVAQRNGIEQGRVPGPRLFISSPILGGWLLWNVPRTPLDGPEHARRAARTALQERIDVVKVYTQLTEAELSAITEEARAVGLPVVGHLSSLDARQAAERGVTCLAHASGVAMATMDDPALRAEMREATKLGISVDFPQYLIYHAFMQPKALEPLIEFLLRHEVALETDLVNTTARWAAPRREAYLAEDVALFDRRDLQYIPQRFRDRILSREAWARLSGEQRELVQRGYETLLQFLGAYHRAGGRLLNGTDTASYVLPGVSTHREMELLVEAGLSPMAAIKASTSAVADYLRKSDLGRVAAGSLADLVLLDRDPLADIRNTLAIDTVFKGGRVADTGYTPRFQNPIPNPPNLQPNLANPVPHVEGVSPARVRLSRSDESVTLTIDGTNFIDESFVALDGAEYPGVPVEDTCIPGTSYRPHFRRLRVHLPASRVPAGTRLLRVINPGPEGGTSNMGYFYVESPD
jgi:imidazolonepropionase-like amidohydrolase